MLKCDVLDKVEKEMIIPYLDFCNDKSKELCKKYHQRHKQIIFANYVR